MRIVRSAPAWVFLVAACASDPEPVDPGGTGGTPPVPPSCAEGTVLHASEEGCVPISAQTCEPGGMPKLGQSDCVPVGWRDCPAGFDLHPSGFACVDRLGAEVCPLGERDDVQTGGCVPIGDCAAAFPPPDASVFVDAAFTAGELDATHVLTIAEALAAAPTGATIAIEAGTYVEALAPSASVRIVGRCAAEVILDSPGGADAGIALDDDVEVEVEGMTITGHRGGILVLSGRLSATRVDVANNRDLGVVVIGSNARADLVETVVRDTLAHASGAIGRGVDIENGGEVTMERTSIAGNRDVGVFVEGAGSSVAMSWSVVRDTAPNAEGLEGRGVNVRMGASAAIADSVAARNTSMGVFAAGESVVSIERSVIRGTRSDVTGMFGRGIAAIGGSVLTATQVSIVDNIDTGVSLEDAETAATFEQSAILGTLPVVDGRWGFGVTAKPGATIGFTASAISDNHDLSVIAAGGDVLLTDTLVQRTLPAPAVDFGFGVVVLEGSTLSATGSAILDHFGIGLLVGGGPSVATIDDSIIRGTKKTAGDASYGFGVVGAEGRVDIVASTVENNAAVGLIYEAAAGIVASSTIADNPIGLVTQGGSSLSEAESAPAEVGALEVVLLEDTSFLGNERRIGSDVVPVPTVEEILGSALP